MPTYATTADVRSFAAGSIYAGQLPNDDPTLNAQIERAEPHIDRALGRGRRDDVTGLLFPTPATMLTPGDQRALSRATAAQVLYMIEMGDEFFVKPQRGNVKGPTFQTSGRLPHIGPQAWEELTWSNLLRLTTHTGTRRYGGEWDERDEERQTAGWYYV